MSGHSGNDVHKHDACNCVKMIHLLCLNRTQVSHMWVQALQHMFRPLQERLCSDSSLKTPTAAAVTSDAAISHSKDFR